MASEKRPITREKVVFILVTLVVIGILQLGSMQIQKMFAQAVYDDVKLNLGRTLDTVEHSLTRWLDEQSAGARYWATQRIVVEATEELERNCR